MPELALEQSSEPALDERPLNRWTKAYGVRELELAGAAQPFAAGRTVELDHASQTLRLRCPSGQVELSIRITERGPVLVFEGAALEIALAGTLRMAVGKLEVHAREGIELHSGGAMVQTAQGDHTVQCQGQSRISGSDVSVTARSGELSMDAAANLLIDGDQVLINC